MNKKLSNLQVDTRVKAADSTNDALDKRHQDEEFVRMLLTTITKTLVSHPEDISVNFSRGDRTTVYTISCTQRVIGQIIGSKGKTILSLRTLISGMTCLKGFRSVIEIPYFKRETEA